LRILSTRFLASTLPLTDHCQSASSKYFMYGRGMVSDGKKLTSASLRKVEPRELSAHLTLNLEP
jgi:hypothetical protein